WWPDRTRRAAAMATRPRLSFMALMARFPARTPTITRQAVSAGIELARGPVFVVMAAAPAARTQAATSVGERGLVRGVGAAAGLRSTMRRCRPATVTAIGAVAVESAAGTVGAFALAMMQRMIVTLFASRCGMQPFPTLFQVLRAGFEQAFGNRPEF